MSTATNPLPFAQGENRELIAAIILVGLVLKSGTGSNPDDHIDQAGFSLP
jgi:hypothetical protein